MRHLLALNRYRDRKNRRETIDAKLAQNKQKQREQLDRMHGSS